MATKLLPSLCTAGVIICLALSSANFCPFFRIKSQNGAVARRVRRPMAVQPPT
jgi:hypothetical protein